MSEYCKALWMRAPYNCSPFPMRLSLETAASHFTPGGTLVRTLAPELWLRRACVSLPFVSGSSSKKERQGSEVLTLMLQALQTIAASEALPPSRVLVRAEPRWYRSTTSGGTREALVFLRADSTPTFFSQTFK